MAWKFNRHKFFQGFRDKFDDTIEQEQVDGLEFLLGQFETDPHWKDVRHIAYALATTYHETAGSFQPVEEGYYLGSASRVKAFQKTLRYYPYFGRGYVQLTWETKRIPNYSKASKALGIDFVKKPELVMIPENAFNILTLGMFEGWFTSKKLTDFISDTGKDYKNARKIINGLDKAVLIAGYANQFEDILRASKVSTAANATAKPIDDSIKGINETANQSEQPSIVSPTGPAPASLVALATPVIEVESVTAAPTDAAPKEGTLNKIGNKIVAFYTIVAGTLAGIATFLTSTPVGIAVSIIGCCALLGLGYMLINWRRDENQKKREAATKEREDVLKQQRENQAFELQKLTLQSAMHKELNTVRIVSPPTTEVPNSDTETKPE